MSLIQDALKRQQEESESSRVPLKAAAAPSVPDAMPVMSSPEPANRPLPADRPLPVDPEKPVQPGKSRKWLAGIIVFCILIGLLLLLIIKPLVARTLIGSFMPNLTYSRAILAKSSVQAPPPAAQLPAMAMSKTLITPSPVRASASRLWISPAAAAAPAFADEGEDVEEGVDASSVKKQGEPGAVSGTATWPQPKSSTTFNNPGADQEDARLKPVVWPRLKLSAIFSNVGYGQSGARLNNRLILLGDQIEGVTLLEIRRDSVVLKYGQEVRFLKMGATLN